MAKIKHIALTTENPGKTAAFYKEAFGLTEVRRSPNGAVFLTDGHINLAILNWKPTNRPMSERMARISAVSTISALKWTISTPPASASRSPTARR